MRIAKIIAKYLLLIVLFFAFLYVVLSFRPIPREISYGVSFSKLHSDELGLDWKKVYSAILDDLGAKKLRLSAHWPMIEPVSGQLSYTDLDYQINEAEKRGTEIILAVGRRLPGWPECHEPDWAKNLSWEERKEIVLGNIEKTVLRYKDSEGIKYWQVENEPFLEVFAKEHCGELDWDFLREEIALVKELDPERNILVTDSGNLGLWYGAWRAGDIFGTSVYIYLWNPQIGEIKTVYRPSVYRAKTRLLELIAGKKKSILAELSLEPWLLSPISETPLDVQIERMSQEKFDEVIRFAKRTGFSDQYLWGAEWWYWMKEQGNSAYWDKAKDLFLSE